MLKKIFYAGLFTLPILFVFLKKNNISNENYDPQEQKAFEIIYKKGTWSGYSGMGSRPGNAVPYLKLLQQYFDNPKFKTIVDLGCGDWQLMEKIKIPGNKNYKGFDVASQIIEANKKKYTQPNVHFALIEGLKDMVKEKGDLLIIKDVMQHWPTKQIHFLIEKILPNFKYALITNTFFSDSKKNNFDIKYGEFRGIDLEASQFNIKNKIKLVMDYKNPKGRDRKKVYVYTN